MQQCLFCFFCYCSVTKSCLTLCDPMECSMPGSVSHYLLGFLMSIEVVILSKHLTLCGPPFFFYLRSFPASGSFLWVSSSHQVAKVVEVQLQNQSFSEYSGLMPFGLTGLTSLQSKGLSTAYPAPQFKSINSLALSLLYSPTLTSAYDYWKNHSFDSMNVCQQSDVSAFWWITSATVCMHFIIQIICIFNLIWILMNVYEGMRHTQIQIYLPGNLVYFYCITLLYCYLAHLLAWGMDFQEDLKAFSSRLLSQLPVSFTWARWHSHLGSLLHISGTSWILEMEGVPGVVNTRASPVDGHLLSALVVLWLESLVMRSFKNVALCCHFATCTHCSTSALNLLRLLLIYFLF